MVMPGDNIKKVPYSSLHSKQLGWSDSYILIHFSLMATKKAKATGKIRISVKAFEHKLVDDAVAKILATVKDSGAIVVGPIPLPTKIEKITLNRSTFVNKNAREQFEIRRHKRLIDVLDPTAKTMELLQSLSIPSGVGVEIKVM
jgi:small subunit ribosomal protein S10